MGPALAAEGPCWSIGTEKLDFFLPFSPIFCYTIQVRTPRSKTPDKPQDPGVPRSLSAVRSVKADIWKTGGAVRNMSTSFFVGFINLFFVPMLPVYLYYKKEGRPIKPSLELLFQYGSTAALNLPLTKILVFLPSRFFLPIAGKVESSYYTIAALLSACLLANLPRLWKATSSLLSFLFQAAPDPLWPAGKRAAYHTYRLFALLAAGLLLGGTLLLLDSGPNEDALLFHDHLGLLLLNAAPVALLALLFWGIAGRVWLGFLLGGGICLCLCLSNYYKLAFRNDPLVFKDLLLLGEARDMAAKYSLFIDANVKIVVLCFLLLAVLLRFLAPGRIAGWRRRAAVSGIVLLMITALAPIYANSELYSTITRKSPWIPTKDYIRRGFLYPFAHSIGHCVDLPPAGYSRSETEEYLSAYQDADIPADRRINIIAVMRESYVDFSRYDIEGFDSSGYDIYHTLEAESYTGDLVTNIFAGGTVDTERCFLTGDYCLPEFRSNANSYSWYMRGQGYTVEGCHPYLSWYYNRKNVNAYLGFEQYRFWENDFEAYQPSRYLEDADLFSEIYEDFQKNKSTDKPCFSFSVTMQSHGPYGTDDLSIPLYLDERYSHDCRYNVSNYLSLIWESDAALWDFVEELRSDPEPVVLVTFGDHLPSMDTEYYAEMGVNLDTGTEDGFFTYYSTRYLIWANDAAKELLGRDIRGEGEAVSPCYLMNVLFDQLGWDGPAFLQAMGEMMEVFPVVTTNGGYVADGALVSDIPESRRKQFQDLMNLQYYWRTRFLYGDL